MWPSAATMSMAVFPLCTLPLMVTCSRVTVVHGVQDFRPGRAAYPVWLASAGAVRDDDVLLRPAAKRAQTASGIQ